MTCIVRRDQRQVSFDNEQAFDSNDNNNSPAVRVLVLSPKEGIDEGLRGDLGPRSRQDHSVVVAELCRALTGMPAEQRRYKGMR